MNTVLVYYSEHHGNTKKLLEAIAAADSSVALIDVTKQLDTDLSSFDRIGFASASTLALLRNRSYPLPTLIFRITKTYSISTRTARLRAVF